MYKILRRLTLILASFAWLTGCNGLTPAATPDEDVQVTQEGFGTDALHTAHRHELPPVNSIVQDHPRLTGRPEGVRVPAFGLERTAQTARAIVPAGTAIRVGLRVLVLTTSTTDEGYMAVRDMLSRLAVPFDAINTAQETVTAARLETRPGEGKYDGIILTTGDLAIDDGHGHWVSSLSDPGWLALADYETTYRVRRLTMFAWPEATTNGLESWGATGNDLSASLTPEGQQVFSDLQASATIPVRWTYSYLATPASADARPLLQTPTGETLAAIYSAGVRENLVLTMAHSRSTPHTIFLSYGLIRWLTRGVFIGERRTYLSVHVDDLFIWSTQWDAVNNKDTTNTYRMTASDLRSFVNWQRGFRNRFPLFRDFTADMLFNGVGFDRSAPASCELPTPAGVDGLSALAKCPAIKNELRFVNHTFTHATFERDTPRATFEDEITRNAAVATDADALGLPVGWEPGQFDATALVTGSHSALGDYWWHRPPENRGRRGAAPGLIQAAEGLGIKTLGSAWSSSSNCTSTPLDCDFRNPSPNTGNRFPTTLPINDLLIQPRFAPAITPNTSTPAQVRSYTNTVYNNTLSYTQILDADTDDALTNLGGMWVDAVYFHQANLRKFSRSDGAVRCLLCDWLERLAKKYSALYRTPITNLSMTPINRVMRERARLDASGASGVWNKTTGIVTLLADDVGLSVPITDAAAGAVDGVDRVIRLQSGQSASVGTN